MGTRVSFVLPAYHEEARIRETLEAYTAFYGPLLREEYEILVVCDGCTDRTAAVTREFAAGRPAVRCLEFPRRLGKGGGVLAGLREARGEIVGFVDADNSFEARDVLALIEAVRAGTDCAIASKWKGRSFREVPVPLVRKLVSRTANLMIRLLFRLDYHDTQAGAKFMRRQVLEALPPLACTGFEFDVEMLWQMGKRGFSIREIPLPVVHKEGSKVTLRGLAAMYGRLLRLRLGGRGGAA